MARHEFTRIWHCRFQRAANSGQFVEFNYVRFASNCGISLYSFHLRLLNFTIFIWQVISALHFPLCKGGLRGILSGCVARTTANPP